MGSLLTHARITTTGLNMCMPRRCTLLLTTSLILPAASYRKSTCLLVHLQASVSCAQIAAIVCRLCHQQLPQPLHSSLSAPLTLPNTTLQHRIRLYQISLSSADSQLHLTLAIMTAYHSPSSRSSGEKAGRHAQPVWLVLQTPDSQHNMRLLQRLSRMRQPGHSRRSLSSILSPSRRSAAKACAAR